MTTHDRSLTDLVRDAANDFGRIAENELRLAKAEIQTNVRGAINGLTEMVIAAALLIPGVTVLLVAIAYGLMEGAGMEPWLAFGIVAIVATLVGAALALQARRKIGVRQLTPDHTVSNLRRDARAVREAV